MAPRGTIWGSICIEVTLSDIETIWTKFGQNLEFSLRNSVSLTPGPTVNIYQATCISDTLCYDCRNWKLKSETLTPILTPTLPPDGRTGVMVELVM